MDDDDFIPDPISESEWLSIEEFERQLDSGMLEAGDEAAFDAYYARGGQGLADDVWRRIRG